MYKITENKFNTSTELVRRLTTVFYLLLMIPLFAFTVLMIGNYEYVRIKPSFTISQEVILGATGFTLLSVFWAYRKFRKADGMKEGTLKQRLVNYYNHLASFYIVTQAAFFMSVFLYYASMNNLMVLMVGLLLGVCSMNSPSLLRIAKRLGLKGKEKDIILKGLPIEE